jgi:hypothetical protein
MEAELQTDFTFQGETRVELLLGLHVHLELPCMNTFCLHVIWVSSNLLLGYYKLVIERHASAHLFSCHLLRIDIAHAFIRVGLGSGFTLGPHLLTIELPFVILNGVWDLEDVAYLQMLQVLNQ